MVYKRKKNTQRCDFNFVIRKTNLKFYYLQFNDTIIATYFLKILLSCTMYVLCHQLSIYLVFIFCT